MASSWRKDRIRQSWQPRELSGTPARLWLVVRRITATLVAIGLIGVCSWLLIRFLWAPNTYFVDLSAGSYEPSVGRPIAFVAGDLQALRPLVPAFARDEFFDPFAQDSTLTAEVLRKHLSQIATFGTSSRDIVIVYLTAHGVVQRNNAGIYAALQCEASDNDSGQARVPVSEVLDALKNENVAARTKILILDAGRDPGAGRVGMALNTFPILLQRAVAEAKDPYLWVLSANSPLERSYVSPASGRSVFGHALAKGLSGGADFDGDQIICLDELYDYVQHGVRDWVKKATDDDETQTPLLYHCDAGSLDREKLAACRVTSTRRLTPGALSQAFAEASRQAIEQGSEQLAEIEAEGGEKISEARELLGDNEGDSEDSKSKEAGQAKAPNESGRRDPSNGYSAIAEKRRSQAWPIADQAQASPAGTIPGVIRLPRWQEPVAELLWYDDFCTAGIPTQADDQWNAASRGLDRITKGLTSFVTGGAAAEFGGVAFRDIPTGSFSLAMAEILATNAAEEAEQPRTKELADFTKAFGEWLDLSDESTFVKLDSFGKKENDKPEELVPIESRKPYYELQLLHRLRAATDIPWDLARSLLATRRKGEEAAANILCGEGWVQDAIERADRLRWEAERLVADRTRGNWGKLAAEKLEAAGSLYTSAANDLRYLESAIALRNRLLARSPEYVRWAHLGDGSSVTANKIKELFAKLAAVSQSLRRPGRESIQELRNIRIRELETAHRDLEEIVFPGEVAGFNLAQVVNLLDTAIPSAAQRNALRAQSKARRFELDLSTTRADAGDFQVLESQQERAQEQFDLELALARLAGCGEAAIDSTRKRVAAATGDLAEFDWRAADALAALYDERQKSLESPTGSGEGQIRDDAAHLAEMRTDAMHWLLVGARFRNNLDEDSELVAALNRAAWHRLLAWQAMRFRRAANDAPLADVEDLLQTAKNYQRLAREFPDLPTAPIGEPPVQFVTATDKVSLSVVESAREQVRLLADRATSVQLVAQYDREKLRVTGDVPTKSADFPVDDGVVVAEAEKAELASGQEKNYGLRVDRLPNARGNTKLILKAVAENWVVRHEFDVELPGEELLDLAVDEDDRQFWSPDPGSDGISLHPLPKQNRDYPFVVINKAKVAKQVEVAFLLPGETFALGPIDLPAGSQRPDAAQALIKKYGPFNQLGPRFRVQFAAGQERASLTADAKVEPDSNLLLKPSDDALKFAGIRLQYGLLVTMTDIATGETTFRRVKVQPRRQYLKAWAQYNPSDHRLQVNLQGTANVVPKEGLKARLEVDRSFISSGLNQVDRVTLAGPDYSRSLFVHLTSNAPEYVTAYVHLDGFPRAFIFNVSTYVENHHIDPSADTMAVRITKPKAGATDYPGSTSTVPVEIQVDAPEGAFTRDEGDYYVLVGFDANNDGTLQNEAVKRIGSDREVDVRAMRLSPTGTLTLNTEVRDITVDVEVSGNQVEGNLRAELITPRNRRPSDQVEIKLDGVAPIIFARLPRRQVPSGTELDIQVFDQPPDLTGIDKVEAIFEINSRGAEPIWVEGKLAADGKTWLITLPTKGMLPGPYTILFRAVDKVKNESNILRESLNITAAPAAPGSAPAPEVDVRNVVSGRVLYVGKGISAQITLEALAGAPIGPVSTDAQGRFRIPNVPPGMYRLKARSTEQQGGYPRTSELDISVRPRPESATTIEEIDLK